jgi:dihydrofolate reductase
MLISIIVAVSENGAIGKNNELLWRLSEDLKIFKRRTSGHAIIMGRKTFDSIGKPLPNRLNIVISRNSALKIDGCEIANSLEKAIEIAKEKSEKDEIFIIGGEKIYNLSLNLANKVYLTKVKAKIDGDAFFDISLFEKWKIVSKIDFKNDEKNEYDFEILELEK